MVFSKITDQIYVGGRIGQADWKHLRSLGITVDISLQEENKDDFDDVDAFLWLPSIDWAPPSLEQLAMGANFIDGAVKAGKKVYVHCFAGVGRAPTLCAAYFVLKGMTAAEALAFVAKAHPAASPNRAQKEALAEFERCVTAYT